MLRVVSPRVEVPCDSESQEMLLPSNNLAHFGTQERNNRLRTVRVILIVLHIADFFEASTQVVSDELAVRLAFFGSCYSSTELPMRRAPPGVEERVVAHAGLQGYFCVDRHHVSLRDLVEAFDHRPVRLVRYEQHKEHTVLRLRSHSLDPFREVLVYVAGALR